jgi:hypothetical protein
MKYLTCGLSLNSIELTEGGAAAAIKPLNDNISQLKDINKEKLKFNN